MYTIAPIVLNAIFMLTALCLALFAARDLLLAGFVALTGCFTLLYYYFSGGRARKNLAKLENLRKSLKSDSKIGETILVPSGERIPADGVILEGESILNEFPLTGSPQQIMKRKDDWAYAVTINEDGDLKICVKQTGENTMIAKVIGAVREAGKFPTVFQKKMALTAVVFGAVILSGSAAYFWKTGNIDALTALLFMFFINHGVFFAGRIWGARVSKMALHGAVVRKAEAFEKAAFASGVIFNSDAYLSRSKKDFSYMRAFWGALDNDILALVASAEKYSDHPLADAILAEAHRKGIKYKDPESFSMTKGEGVTAVVDGAEVIVGSENLLIDNNIHIQDEIKKYVEAEKQKGMDTAIVARDKKIICVISFGDIKRAELKTTASQLETLGIKEAGKEDANRRVLIVGDGTADAVGSSEAVLVAIGVLGGSGVFPEKADILLMGDSFGALQKMIVSGRETAAALKIMFISLFGLSIIGILLVWIGFFGPYKAALFHIIVESFIFISVLHIAKKDGMV